MDMKEHKEKVDRVAQLLDKLGLRVQVEHRVILIPKDGSPLTVPKPEEKKEEVKEAKPEPAPKEEKKEDEPKE